MSIIFNEKEMIFTLNTPASTYSIGVYENKYLSHLGWNRRTRTFNFNKESSFIDRSFSPNPLGVSAGFSLDSIPLEYPTAGRSDFRNPAIEVTDSNNSIAMDLFYKGFTIFKGKPELSGLPSTYIEDENEVDTLEIELEDSLTKVKVILVYSVWNNRDVITRNVRVINCNNSPITLRKVLSGSIDFNNSDFNLMQLSGAHCRERHPIIRPLFNGLQGVESRRGSSSHQQNPFIALLDKDATEDFGNVYGFNLVYSGNFSATVEVDQFESSRVSLGINPFNFSWILKKDEVFQSPELVMVFSSNGIGEMSRTYHDLYRERICRGSFRDKTRPVVINNWEATYFDFNQDKLLELADSAAECGIDMFVLDDGWFGTRDDDKTSLGDWFLHKSKLPGGLDNLSKEVGKKGMEFGLWVEPEMISPDSELYRAHPDWCLHINGREGSLSRSQLVLDLSRDDVCDYLINILTDVFSSANITYVKWDMNRHLTEVESAILDREKQREVSHRYVLGLYKVLEALTTKFSNILFESCSGGGGRFDPGMLYYMPQTWTSDNTDAISRLWIQFGTNMVYPTSTMSCHVSAVPNHQVNRTTPLSMRGNVAMAGTFGYELDLTKNSPEERKEIATQIERYKAIEETVMFGDLYRLVYPWEDNSFASWINVKKDKSEAVLTCVWILTEANSPFKILKLKGLDPNKDYLIKELNEIYGGDELMYRGLKLPDGVKIDSSLQYHLLSV